MSQVCRKSSFYVVSLKTRKKNPMGIHLHVLGCLKKKPILLCYITFESLSNLQMTNFLIATHGNIQI